MAVTALPEPLPAPASSQGRERRWDGSPSRSWEAEAHSLQRHRGFTLRSSFPGPRALPEARKALGFLV